jgi:DNA invertase Pin-like site-specific DNA recombinase
MAMKTPIAYLRKSRVIDERVGVSWEVQEGKVRELAAQHGDNGERLLILSDWNISGRKGPTGRPSYKRLVNMIEADEVAAIYSYNLARLSRSVQDLRALMKLADEHGVPVRLVADHVDTSTATGRMLLTMLAAVDEMTADLASEHARDAVAVRRARGDRIGHPFYGERPGEDIDAVVAAFDEAGSVLGACRLLNERHVPTRMGGPWATVSVREILVRRGAMPHRTRPGAKAQAPFALYGLLRCHCGHVLTGTRYRNGSDPLYTTYKCHFARTVPGHGLGSVPEKRILPLVQAEVARLRVPDAVTMAADNAAQRAALAGRLERAHELYIAGSITRERLDVEAAAVAAELERLGDAERVVAVPHLDWQWDPGAVNSVLRTILERVQLDADMRPVLAVWTVPEWRAPDEEPAAPGNSRVEPPR